MYKCRCAVCADQLSPNHHQEVLNLVWEARPKYYNIGLALELPAGTIDAMEISHSRRVDAIFTEMVGECLRQGLVTQQKLADAVSSPQVSLEYLKEGILAKKFTASKPTQCKLGYM